MATQTAGDGSSPARYGEVFDRGYKRYTGERLGRKQAFRSLVFYSMKRAMGIRKPWTSKILPILLYAAALVPLVVMIGVNAIAPDAGFATYADYLAAIFVVVGIFVATTAPEMLCVDRHERTLPLYFSRAITRFDYVVAKIAAMTLLTMTLSMVPLVILWLGKQLTSAKPGEAMRENIDDLGRVIFVGSLIALVLGMIGLVISSFTTRKPIAVGVIFVGFVVTTALANAALELLQDYEWSRYLILMSVLDTFEGLYDHVIPDNVTGTALERANLPLATYLGYLILLVVAGVMILLWRYRPLDES